MRTRAGNLQGECPVVKPASSGAGIEDRLGALAERHPGSSKFNTARRAFTILDLISRHEGLTAKALARELGVSLSTCYCLINILVEEGFVEKIAHRKGYRLGPAVSLLYSRARRLDVDSRVEPAVEELAARSNRHAYFGLISDDNIAITQVKSPPRKPPVGLVKGSPGASHALALGKILIAHAGPEGVETYADAHGLAAFTPRTVTDPGQLEAHLVEVRLRGYATDLEEFSENLCCVAAPIVDGKGRIEGALGISTNTRHFYNEPETLIELVSKAAREASTLLG